MIDTLSSTALGAYDIEVLSDPGALPALRPYWERLTDASQFSNVFSTFEWIWGWWHYIAQGAETHTQRLNILILRHAGEVVGIIPLLVRLVKKSGVVIRKIEFIGRDSLFDYQAPLFANDYTGQANAVVDFLVRTRDQWDIIELHNLTPQIATFVLPAFERALPTRVDRGEDCPFFLIEGPWDTVAQRATKPTRQTLRNQANRLEREGILCRIVERPDAEPGLLDRLTELESRKLVRGKAGDLVLARWPEFFSFVFRELAPKGWIGVALMEKGSVLISYNLFFRCGKSIWDYTKAYDPAFSKFSPGTMLLPAIVDYAHSHAYREYDFLRGGEPYKMKWATCVRTTCHLQAWHGGWRSRFAALLYFSIARPAFRVLARVNEGW
jgi:CelD/BcsL family acetyltransferase involved in cellulose biosynthesis